MHEEKHSLVNSPRDPRFLALRSLQTTQGRFRTGLYLIEGIRHVARAVDHHAPIQSFFVDPSVLSNPFGRKLARQLTHSGVPSLQLSRQLYREFTLAAEPQGIGAVLRQQWAPINGIHPQQNSTWLAVESIDSPGNLGTIIRTAEATGVAGIFIIGSDTDPFDPAAVRASMGSLFSQKLVKCTAREFTDWARSSRVSVIASSPAGLLDYKALRCRWPTVLLMGSERHGLSDHLIEASDFTVASLCWADVTPLTSRSLPVFCSMRFSTNVVEWVVGHSKHLTQKTLHLVPDVSDFRWDPGWPAANRLPALAKETPAFCRSQGLTRDETRITKHKLQLERDTRRRQERKKTMPKTHSKNKRPSNREKHSRAQGSKANQAKVNAWKEYKSNGGTLSLTAWAKQHW